MKSLMLSILVLLSVSTSFAQYRDSSITQRLDRLVSRCDQTRTYQAEASCLRNGILNIIGRADQALQCVGTNAFGKYAEGGGCNAFGCYYPGGSCNAFGCNYEGGSCNAFGCTKQAPKTDQACSN